MWSPKQKVDGTRNQFYENMRAVSPGDVVFSFCDTRIKAIGVVTGGAEAGPKPDFGAAGLNWSTEGWFVLAWLPGTLGVTELARTASSRPSNQAYQEEPA